MADQTEETQPSLSGPDLTIQKLEQQLQAVTREHTAQMEQAMATIKEADEANLDLARRLFERGKELEAANAKLREMGSAPVEATTQELPAATAEAVPETEDQLDINEEVLHSDGRKHSGKVTRIQRQKGGYAYHVQWAGGVARQGIHYRKELVRKKPKTAKSAPTQSVGSE